MNNQNKKSKKLPQTRPTQNKKINNDPKNQPKLPTTPPSKIPTKNDQGKQSQQKRTSQSNVKNVSKEPQSQRPNPKPKPAQSQILSQTPQNRKKAKIAKKLNPQEIEIRRKKQELKRFYIKKRRADYLKLLYRRFVVFLIMFSVMFTVIISGFFVNLFKYNKATKTDFSYQIGPDKSKTTKVIWSNVIRNDDIYVDITSLSKYFEFTTTGDINELKFISKNKENDNVKFIVHSEKFFINGVETRLSSPVFIENQNLYVPIDFFQTYVKGIEVTFDKEKRKITIIRNEIQNTSDIVKNTTTNIDEDEIQYEDIEFIIKKPIPLINIIEEELSPDLILLTNPKVPETTPVVPETTPVE